MTGCNNNCGSCKDKASEGYGADFNPSRTNRTQTRSDEFLPLMKNQPEPKGDLTSLDQTCPHYEFGTIQRSGCEICLKMWAIAHDHESCIEMVKELKQSGKTVAATRLTEIIKTIKINRPDWATK